MTSNACSKLRLASALAALALGCQAPDEVDPSELLAQAVPCEPSIDGGVAEPTSDASVGEDASTPAAPDAGPRVRPDPNVPFFAEVTANGTGCPRGSWNSQISPDGTDFRVVFSQYEATVEEGQRISFKDCNLTVKLHTPANISYAISNFHYEGYAYLEKGVKGFQTASYYFQGNPVPSADQEKRTDLTGPVDRSYLFQENVKTTDVVWSPCGLDRNLQIVTRLGLQKNQNAGSGYINVQEIRGPRLVWRKC